MNGTVKAISFHSKNFSSTQETIITRLSVSGLGAWVGKQQGEQKGG